MKRNLMFLLIPVLLYMLSSCKKESADLTGTLEKKSTDSFMGTWVSTDKADTLYVIDDHLFNKALQVGYLHTFEYSFSGDSITIMYKGPNKIWVMPTTHYFTMGDSEITIDFSNGCYGFNNEKETFSKL